MQTYVNVDWSLVTSIVGLTGQPDEGKIVAEARYFVDPDSGWAKVAFLVDEPYQNLGISSYLLNLLIGLGRERHLKGFLADVLNSNFAMVKVFKKCGLSLQMGREAGVYHVRIAFLN